MLFTREVEAQPLDTPERRAALERRLRECAGQIRDDVLKRHYLDDFRERQAVLFGRSHQNGWNKSFAPKWNGKRNAPVSPRSPLEASSALLQTSFFAVRKETPGPREILILALLLNHPALLARHAEDIAPLDFSCASGRALRDALLGVAEPDMTPHELHEKLFLHGFGAILEDLAGDATVSTLWCVRPEAHQNDAEVVLLQALALHRRQRALNRELRLAQTAHDHDPSDANWAAFVDIRERLSSLEGVEATVEGFGAHSGREEKSV
jgi:DNA primase